MTTSVTLSAAAFLAVASGCATTDDSGNRARIERGRDAVAALISNDDGLEALQWAIGANPDHVASTLITFEDGPATTDDRLAWLRRNGLQLVRIRMADVVPLRSALGPASLNLTAWHGQVRQWREIIKRTIGPGVTALVVNGRVNRYEPGAVRLMVRAWTMPMESGPYLVMELLPVHDRNAGSGIGRLIGDGGLTGSALIPVAIELALEPGYAYVLTGAASRRTTSDSDADSESAAASTDDSTPRGPAAPTPPTIGELLFVGHGNPPAQGFMVFLPRLALDPLEPVGSRTMR